MRDILRDGHAMILPGLIYCHDVGPPVIILEDVAQFIHELTHKTNENMSQRQKNLSQPS
jgi:hypothetical protein